MRGEAQIYKGRLGKLAWAPFEALIGMLMVRSGASRLLGEPLAPLAPEWLSILGGAIYLIGGLCLLVGMWRMALQVEIAGHVALILGTTVVTSVGFIYEGSDIFADFVVFIAISWAAGTHLYQLARGRIIVQLEGRPFDERD